MPPPDAPFRDWWPTTQSLDLVEGACERVAEAVREEFSRFGGQSASIERRGCHHLNVAFGPITTFFNVPTSAVLLPTRSKWTVIWYNTFLCDGYDSLCWCLTSRHSLPTIHWSAHDEWTTFQSASSFHFRKNNGHDVVERCVTAAQTDKKWDFFAIGAPLVEEDVAGYATRKKRDRLNERRTMELLARLDAKPWVESFYGLPGDVFTVSRPPVQTMHKRRREDVLAPYVSHVRA